MDLRKAGLVFEIERAVTITKMLSLVSTPPITFKMMEYRDAYREYQAISQHISNDMDKPTTFSYYMPLWNKRMFCTLGYGYGRPDRKSRPINVLNVVLFWDIAYYNNALLQLYEIPCRFILKYSNPLTLLLLKV